MTYIYRWNCSCSDEVKDCKPRCTAQIYCFPSLKQRLVEMLQFSSPATVYQLRVHLNFHRKRDILVSVATSEPSPTASMSRQKIHRKNIGNVLLLSRNEVELPPFPGSKCNISPFAEAKEAQLIFHAEGVLPLNFLPGHHYKAKANERCWFPPQGVKKQGTGMTERIC